MAGEIDTLPLRLLKGFVGYDLNGLAGRMESGGLDGGQSFNATRVLPPGHLTGNTLSNNGTDATNDIDIAAGLCRDSTDLANIVGTALTKQLDAAWAAGSAAGGRMSAAAIADTTYHLFRIFNPTTGQVDAGFDVSPTAPTLPPGYTLFRRIGSIIRKSGAILPFIQNGDTFQLVTPVTDRSGDTAAVAATNITVTVPTGIVVAALMRIALSASALGAGGSIAIFIGAIATTSNKFIAWLPTTGRQDFSSPPLFTNTSAQLSYQFDLQVSATVVLALVASGGWVDSRGRS